MREIWETYCFSVTFMNEGHLRDSTEMQSDKVLQNGASVSDSVNAAKV